MPRVPLSVRDLHKCAPYSWRSFHWPSLEAARVKLYPITSDTAHFYSQIFDSLKRKGKPIPTNDVWIAAQALEHGCVVCSYDKHFQAIEGLVVASSLSELIF